MMEQTFSRASFPFYEPIQLRWSDFDMFQHVNNVLNYRFFEHVIIAFMDKRFDFNFAATNILTFARATSCEFLKPMNYADLQGEKAMLQAGLCVSHLGTSSVQYTIGLFIDGDDTPASIGRWTHVYVDAKSHRPVPIPDVIRTEMQAVYVA
jgi:acyl-CoA thioester hydrolase